MLLANCVRRISHSNIAKCLIQSNCTVSKRCIAIAGRSPAKLVELPNLTSTTVFTSFQQRGNGHDRRYYSSHRNDKDDDADDDLDNWHRQLPPFDDGYLSKPSVYLMLKNALSALLIRSYFDENFNRKEFLDGARQAMEVVSNLLAVGNFEELRDMVDDDTINKMRRIVGPMTPEQRKLLVVNNDDIQWIFPYEIQFITKQNSEEKSRFFVEIMVVVHAFRDMDINFELSDFFRAPTPEAMEPFEKNYSVANYRFIKEFTKGVEDDWTINYILHVKPTDEMNERKKVVKEL